MNSLGLASTITVITVSVLYANNAHSQSSANQSGFGDSNGVAAGTRYQLIGTDEVSFGPGIRNEARKELVVKVSPTKAEEQDVDNGASAWRGDLAFDRIDFLKPGEIPMHNVSDGVSYSAGVGVETTDDFNSQSEIVSSRQLGIHYGRLGPENYRAVDLDFRNFSDESVESGTELIDDSDLWSLGVTTGRRFALTGLDNNDPLWTVSLRGQFSVDEDDSFEEVLDKQQWYLSPGLQWISDSFELSADVLMPFIQSGEVEEESDYRIRATIQKNF